MSYMDPESEAVIIQKLDDMKDFLESFMSGLEETEQEKGVREVPVFAPSKGELLWTKWDGTIVRKGEHLGTIKQGTAIEEGLDWIDSPASGELYILVNWGRVNKGRKIAKIRTDVLV